MNNFTLLEDLKFCEKLIREMNEAVPNIEREIRVGNANVAFVWASDLLKDGEKLCRVTREIPLKIGDTFVNGKNKYDQTEELILSKWDIKIEYTEQGWLRVRLPIVAPKIKAYTANSLCEPLRLAVDDFFSSNGKVEHRQMVICYRFIYGKDIPIRVYHDHDNKEIKNITDIITNLFIPDDCPKYLNHYYCSANSDESSTEVYLVPREEFSQWLEYETTLN